MAVFRDKKVPIPRMTGITINRGDNNKVLYVLSAPYNSARGYAEPKRVVIGYVCKDDTKLMHPTDKYRLLFSNDWQKLFQETPQPIVKHLGIYAVVQAVNMKSGIQDRLEAVLGKPASDRILDYAMYSILCHSDSSAQFESRMADQMLFSGKAYSDSSYSRLFEEQISRSDILAFRKAWAQQCREEGTSEVWLCIDGSNDDCGSKGVEIAEKGHAKSKKNVNIVGFTYAVTQEGLPVTFDIYRGGLVDAKAMQEIIGFLHGCGISVRGVILDRGYCNMRAVTYLRQKGIPYVIMIKGQPDGYAEIVRTYGNEIRMKAEHLVEGSYLFAIQQRARLFEGQGWDDFITLFYDYRNASDRITRFLEKLYREAGRIREVIAKGGSPEVSKDYKKYLTINETDGRKAVELDRAALQEAIDGKGLYGILTSEGMAASDVHWLYASRNASETQYMFVKTQLGYGKLRICNTQGAYAKFMVGFVASVIRYEIEQAAKELGRSATEMINEMNRLEAVNINGTYVYAHTENCRQIEFLKNLGSGIELLDEVTKDENDRISGRTPTARHRKTGPKKETARAKSPSAKDKATQKKKPGPKPGTIRTSVNKDGSERKKPGPKPGYKHGEFNKDGSPRQKPGPKPGLHRSDK